MNIQIIPNKYKTEDSWGEVLSLDTHTNDTELYLDWIPKWTPGTHPNLHYRGKAINRSKLTCHLYIPFCTQAGLIKNE